MILVIVDSTLNICIKGFRQEALMISSKQYCGISNGSRYAKSYAKLCINGNGYS